jgi:hypothetical protein
LELEKQVADASLFNLEGKFILANENVQQINTSNLAKGV